ncbi:hypothetical protein P22_0698 [Propionispora sp. 2/2-37]|uniref:Rossmann-like and DUF2520 domain-containing protein n=1 Tax=Propionispora sp. 2/2-37 TaxID=1677858 RepID=UPI0006C49839|nr:DUF2520 domain-containing protein [Propionispora sp. 2/2-37]CUH94632.1 hypothetical protein P22_0698 [Propionispora sp. 2/2-37]
MERPAIAIIGAGKVGSALAYACWRLGYRLAGVASRTAGSAATLADRIKTNWSLHAEEITRQADIVFITVPDRYVETVTEQITFSGGVVQGQFIYHVSGSLPVSVLAGAASCGARIGSMHPLQSFTFTETAWQQFQGAYMALDGDRKAVAQARELALQLGSIPFSVPGGQRTLYHAAACMASNYLIALAQCAAQLLKPCGLNEQQAVMALWPLMKGSMDNLLKVGPAKALSGPISRGDGNTVQRHVAALATTDRDTLRLYTALGHYTLNMAKKQGLLDERLMNELINSLETEMGETINETR